MTISTGVALALAAAGFLAPVHAMSTTLGATVPFAYVDSNIYYNPLGADLPALGEVAHTSSLGTVSAAAYATPLPIVEVSGSTGALGTDVGAEAELIYSFIILSSQPGYANVIVEGNANAGGTGSYSAYSESYLLGERDIQLGFAHACNELGACGNVYTSGRTQAVSVPVNTFYRFQVDAQGYTTKAFSSFFASADPTIIFDPAYAIPAGARIVLSPGYAATALPEAATWALLLAGFGMVGGMARRGKQTQAAA